MSSAAQITFEIAKLGIVTMKGDGPWRVRQHSGHSRIIVDKDGREANPFVQSKLRNSANVVFAKLSEAEAIVTKANELLEAQA